MGVETETKKDSLRLFYSYAHEDEGLQENLQKHLAALRNQGIITEWHDRKIIAGSEWHEEISTHLEVADIILLLVSADFLASEYIYGVELKRAIEKHDAGEAMVIPVMLRAVDWQGESFSKLQALPRNAEPVASWDDIDEAFTDVAKGIRKAAEVAKGISSEEEPLRPKGKHKVKSNPYKGLEAFTEEDAEFFYGRQQVVDELVPIVKEQPFLAVVGNSGSGKSSLVFAGLVHYLKTNEADDWLIADLRPQTDPIDQMAGAFAKLLSDDVVEQTKQRLELAKLFREKTSALTSLCKQISEANGGKRILLIIDQFEELYTQLPEDKIGDRELLHSALLEASEPDAGTPLCTLITLRTDFLNKVNDYREFGELVDSNRKMLFQMDDKELQAAIELPDGEGKSRVDLESGLTKLISKDVANELSLLQFALARLWEESKASEGYQLSYDAYWAIGGVQGALANHADAIYEKLSEAEQQQVKNIMVRLVSLGEGVEDTRKIATYQEIGEDNWEMVRTLANAKHRLVKTDTQEGDDKVATAEVIHESLIRNWGKFRDWIDESREFLRWLGDLRQSLGFWKESGEDDAALLSGFRLDQALQNKDNFAMQLQDEEIAFIKRSEEHRVQEIAREEAQQRDALEQSRALAMAEENLRLEAEQRGEEQRKSTNRFRWLSGFLSFAVVGTLIAAGLFLNTRNDAVEQEKIALSRQLSAQANLAANKPSPANGSGDLAALLAIQSRKVFKSHETESALVRSIQNLSHLQATWHMFDTYQPRPSSHAYSPDGTTVISGHVDGTLRLWNVQTGETIGEPWRQGHSEYVVSVAFSPNGKKVVSGSTDHKAILWDVETGETIGQVLDGHTDAVFSVAFSPNGTKVITGSFDKTLILWDVQTGSAIGQPWKAHTAGINGTSFSPDGTKVISGSHDETLILWDAQTGLPIGKPWQGHTDSVTRVDISPDGTKVISGSYDDTLVLWNLSTGKSIGRAWQGHTDNVNGVAFSPDGTKVVSVSDDTTVILWKTQTGKPIDEVWQGHTAPVTDVAFSPDGSKVVSSGADKTLRLWTVQTGVKISQVWKGHKEGINSAAFSPDGKKVVSGSDDTTLILWDVQTGEPIGEAWQGHADKVYTVAFSPDGTKVVSGSADSTIKLWDVQTGKLIGKSWTGHFAGIRSVAFSPKGTQVVSGSFDNTIKLWDVYEGEPIGSPWLGHFNSVASVAFSPDGTKVISGGGDFSPRLWDVQIDGLQHNVWNGNNSFLWSLAFSPDGKQVISGGYDPTLRLWDVATGQQIDQPWKGHNNVILSVKYSSDGTKIVSASGDKTVGLWNVDRGELIGGGWKGHTDLVKTVAYSPDGKKVVSDSEDSTLRLWSIDEERWKILLCQIAGRNLSQQEWQKFMGNADYELTCPQFAAGN